MTELKEGAMKLRSIILSAVALLLLLPITHAQCSGEGCVYGISSQDIAAYPEPNVVPLYVDDTLLYDRLYRKVESDLPLFDAPNGSSVGSLGTGFNYVTVMNSQEGWAEISPGKWVPSDGLSEEVVISRFAGVKLPTEGLPYPMAWILRHLRASAEPGAEENPNNPFLYRYTRVNLYSFVEVDGFRWYQIGENQWVHQFNIAKIQPVERPADVDTEKWVGVDLYEQVAIAYEGTTPVFATLVSSGLPQWSTNEGIFHVYIRYPRTLMSGANNQPDFYYLEEVPWTMYFDNDIALHGTYWHDGFGYRQSHGCVNLSITDANWLYDWASSEFDFTVENDKGPAVYVYSSGDYQ